MTSLAQLPGPRVPPLVSALHYGFLPQHYAERNVSRFGRAYRLQATTGGALLATSEPEHLRRIFAADSDTFRTLAAVTLRALFGPRSVLLTHGPVHRQQRKLLAPPLSGSRLRAYGEVMQTLADAQLAALRPGQQVEIHELALRFTLDVIVRTVFGLTDPEAAAELRSLLSSLVHDMPPIAIFAPVTQHRWFPPWARYQRAQQRFDAWLRRAIAERRAAAAQGEDVLSLLLAARYDDGSAMADDEVRDQLMTVLLAGHETTALTLTRCVERLHHEPAALTRLRAELAASGPAPEDVQRLPYLSAVLDETLRIDPIVTDVARIANRTVELGDGLVIERGEGVLVMIEALHRDPALYPEPGTFRPERFLERKFAGHEYAPFGGGVRRCLGAAFSDYESKIFLASLVRNHELAPVHAQLSRRVRRNITMGPAHGVPMRVLR